ncbi:NAD-dependent epimerase/dehydratase family protein [Solimonas marina]|uniref:NAD-dependent epimerase/dehydratase family protein n=1 Tax=Solimonas marina TaxID=2714601 RepID=A0A970B4N8_9GAMM|nr:NAD-dependent epimerase/dehydratase family protein [Solimonas marina]NKF20828.1 NAD-dependent epimerase/dehydratase family protein [Solimonas marina]
MNVLVLGGTGLIGGHAALHLQSLGHRVTLGARKPAQAGSALADLPFLAGDYIEDEGRGGFSAAQLSSFDALLFAAGNDIRHVARDADADAHWQRANVDGVPRFFRRARDAGIRRAVLVGSFYPQVDPSLIDRAPYVRSRHLSDVGVRELADPDFHVCSVNAPFVVGSLPGLQVPMFDIYTRYALGQMPQIPVYAPAGGVNFISTRSLSEAITGAFERGHAGTAYLVGDENLTFSDYLSTVFEAAGRPQAVPALDQEHPLLPDAMLYAGRGTLFHYDADERERALLGYRRGDARAAIVEAVQRARQAIEGGDHGRH